MNVESFNLDHTKVKAPYIRVADKKTGANGDLIETTEPSLYGHGGAAFTGAFDR